ncbi:MAG: NADPH-dependent glutamate synthase [Candidatus Brocadiaceae bacterium]|nr:NADPH-dependent glutamate synthase [Candidatus Brocadiaceae bacterium]
MFEILAKDRLAPDIYRTTIRAPRIAVARKVGQFVIVRPDQTGERVPLTIAAADPRALSITIVFQAVGASTRKLAAMEPGDRIPDIAGPLGMPTEMEPCEHAVAVGGGVGIALIWPIADALSRHARRLTGILSARTSELLILRDEIGSVCTDLKLATDDGSVGHHGFPTDLLRQLLDSGETLDAVYAVGPVPMMAAVAEVTRPYGVRTVVSLNPIMVDGTGMCGGCRVTVDGQTKFACVDGPEFDGHLVDFAELAHRLKQYEGDPHKRNLPRYESAHSCDRKHTALQDAMIEAGRNAARSAEIPRQPMPEQPAESRVRNFEEVPFGLRPEQAVLEARRCLQCRKPRCVEGCPVGVDIPGFVRLIAEDDFLGAARKLKEDNTLPAVCGRVCPQETQCEALCVLGRKGDPVAIGNLERFAADFERNGGHVEVPALAPSRGIKVAVVGSGPAGLTAAGELARRGYSPTILEALHEPGGVLMYGIPAFRLPKDIVHAEIDLLHQMGVGIERNFVVGKTATIEELFSEGYEAVFIGSGAGTPIFAGVPGENLNGVLSANEYLTRSNLMRGYSADYATPIMVKERVAVLGGGNVAMDAARTAMRLGARQVTLVYRRTIEEAPARAEELKHAEHEGLKFMWLTNSVEVLGNEHGWVCGLRCVRMELGEPGPDGRRRPFPVEGSEFDIPVDMVIVAFGNRPHPLVPQTTPGLEVTKWGTIAADEVTGATSLPGVYAGGDIVTGAATVIQAMGAGKRAAAAIDQYLQERHARAAGAPPACE